MNEVFDTYKKKTNLYYALLVTNTITIALLVFVIIRNQQIPRQYNSLIMILFILGLLIMVFSMIASGTGIIQMYQKEGELTISTDSITIDSIEHPLNEIKKIEINAKDYRGARFKRWKRQLDSSFG